MKSYLYILVALAIISSINSLNLRKE